MLKRLTRLVLLLLGLLLVANDSASSWLATHAVIAAASRTEAFDDGDPRAPDDDRDRSDAICVDTDDADDDHDHDVDQVPLLSALPRVEPPPSTRLEAPRRVEFLRLARGYYAPERRPPRA